MKKDIYCIEADGRMLDVAAKDDLGTVLDAWRGTYKGAEAVPAENRVDTSKPVIHQVRELFEKLDLPYEIWRQGRRIYIEIEWGDWRHDHANADQIMETVFGFAVKEVEVTDGDDDEDDWYGAVHTYMPA